MLTARIWRERFQRYRNIASRCRKCGRQSFPPRKVCDGCRGREFDAYQIAETGKVISWTIIRLPPPGFSDQAPYAVAVLEMDDGTRMMAQLADADLASVKSGMRVRLEFRRIREEGEAGVISYGHKAAPV